MFFKISQFIFEPIIAGMNKTNSSIINNLKIKIYVLYARKQQDILGKDYYANRIKKEQIVKDKPQSILIDYVEYKLLIPKWMVKNNSFIVDDKYTYWVFNLENIKRELSGNELIKLLEPYIKEQKITFNKQEAPKEYYLNDIKLEPLTFYEHHNSWFIGEITDNKTKITNPCFKYNITWEKNNRSFKINNPYNHNDLTINYIVTSYKHISNHNEKVFLI